MRNLTATTLAPTLSNVTADVCEESYDAYQTAQNRMDWIRITCFSIEILINVFSLASGALFALLLCRAKLLQRNPKLLLCNLLISNFATVVTRFVVIVQMISEDTLIRADILAPFSAVHDISVNMNMFNQLSLAFEATLSTFFRSYHKSNASVVFCVLEFAFPWVTSITCYVFEHMGQFDAIPRFLLFEASNVAAWLMLTGLAFINRLFYRQHTVGNILEKFETAVQIRTLSMLNLLAVITGIRNCITVGILLMILFYFTPRCQFHAARTVAHFFDLTVAVYSAFFMVPLLFVNREFGRQFDGLLRRRSVVGVSDKEVRNVIGQRLIVQHDQAAHFGDLKNQWDAMATAQAKRKTI